MFKHSLPIVIAFLINIFAFSLMARVIFEGSQHVENFDTLSSSINTMIKIAFFEDIIEVLS